MLSNKICRELQLLLLLQLKPLLTIEHNWLMSLLYLLLLPAMMHTQASKLANQDAASATIFIVPNGRLAKQKASSYLENAANTRFATMALYALRWAPLPLTTTKKLVAKITVLYSIVLTSAQTTTTTSGFWASDKNGTFLGYCDVFKLSLPTKNQSMPETIITGLTGKFGLVCMLDSWTRNLGLD